MADISRLNRFVNGLSRGIALSENTLVVDNLKIKMGSGNDTLHAIFSGTLTAARTITMPDTNVDLGQIATNASDISTKANDADVIKKDGSVAFTADQSMGNFKLTDLAAPASSNDAARLIDVQTAQAGIKVKTPVDVVATSDITLSGEQTIDGVLTSSSRVLVIGKSSAVDNGIYISAAGAWTRATDYDGTPNGESALGNSVLVLSGTTYSNIIFVLNSTDAADPTQINIGTETNSWVVYSRAEATTASTGLTKVGLDFRLADAALSNGISVSSGAIAIGLATDPGLEFTTNALRVKIKASSGLVRDADGLSVTLGDFSTTDLSEGSNLYFTDARARTAAVDDTAYGVGWDGVTNIAPSKNAVYDKIESLAASNIEYTPNTLTDWDGDADPGETSDALDQLASRTKSLEASTSSSTLSRILTAGETLTTGFRAVRWGKGAETAGRVYLAINDTSSNDDFYVVYLVNATGETAGNTLTGYREGPMTVTSHGFTVGLPLYLDAASGAITQTAPTAADSAVVRLGMAEDANTIDVQISVVGVN